MAHRVLIVDDSPTEREVIHRALTDEDYDLAMVEDGEQALEAIANNPPTLVVLDIILPQRNGFQVCREIKRNAATSDVRILLLSTKSQPSDRFWGEKQGADAYMTKPFDPEELRQTVRDLLE